ncbi:MAG: methionyl-tRNA formyltransferase [Verrucomicrobia bacterium]|nr:methionyl-tRNA formyltransferase [Verrucomicrobiota bacterium]
MTSPLRVIFMGTAPLACASLRALAESPAFEVAAVVTQPDRPKGRDLKLQPSAVKELALALNRPVLQPERARQPEFIEQLRALRPDLIVVAAYGQILPQSLLDVPRLGCLNVHTSLLPKYRGAAPIQWAIANGDAETGVTIMKMDAGLDTGAIVATERTPIADADDAPTLHDRLAQLGAALLVKTVPDFAAGKITPQPQPAEGSSYARKIEKEDGRLDWSQPARVLWQRLRAFTPWPGAFTFLPAQPKPVLLKIRRAEPVQRDGGNPGEVLEAGADGIVVACGEGALRLLEVQREGGKRLAAREFLAGCPLAKSQRLG